MDTKGKEDTIEQRLENLEKRVNQMLLLMEAQQNVVKNNANAVQTQKTKLEKTKRELSDFIENIRYEMTDNKEFEKKYWYPKIMDQKLTMDQILREKKSFVRFTETELDMLIHYLYPKLIEEEDVREDAKEKVHLRKRLFQILKEENERLLIAIPDFFGSLDNYEVSCKKAYRAFLTEERRIHLMEILPQYKNYHDAIIVHPMDYNPVKSGVDTKERFEKLIDIWRGKNVVVVGQQNTMIRKENPYFASVQNMEHILVPAVDALLQYEALYAKCMQKSKDWIFLVAAGPMGVVLVSDLSKQGYQALDVGTLGNHYLSYYQK